MLVRDEVGAEEVVEVSWSPCVPEVVVVDGEGPRLLPHREVIVPKSRHRYVKVGIRRLEIRGVPLLRGQQ
eukprot:6533423-Lingulodinium_polyedra.AAC.1